MKKLFSTFPYKKRNYIISRKQFKRNIVSKLKRKAVEISYIGEPRRFRAKNDQFNSHKEIDAPSNLSLVEEPEKTIQFINLLEKNYLSKTKVFVNLKNLRKLDYSGITVLLSVMFSFKARQIPFDGNFPKNKLLKKRLIESEFFKYLVKPIPNNVQYTIGKRNQIFTKANREVNSELGLPIMIEASSTVWGTKRMCKGLQRVLIELQQNTNNHASNNKGENHWWISVNHDEANQTVAFVFVDYGIGIFESLKNKPQDNKWYGWFEKVTNKLTIGGNEEIFKLLLEGELHLTVTGEHFRGKGLPGIKEVLDRNQISNLCFISNDVLAKVDNNEYTKLRTQFSGTFVCWELNKNNINTEWTI